MELKINLPQSSFSALRTTPEAFLEAMKRAAVSKWYEMRLVSQSKGAEILGVDRPEFIRVLAEHQVSVLQLDSESLAEELSTWPERS